MNDYRTSIATPGMDKNDVQVEVDGNRLTIYSEKEDTKNRIRKRIPEKNITRLHFPQFHIAGAK